MEISTIPVTKHIKLEFEEHVTHVFTFANEVALDTVEKHPAVAALISRKAESNYLLLSSSCSKTIRVKIYKGRF